MAQPAIIYTDTSLANLNFPSDVREGDLALYFGHSAGDLNTIITVIEGGGSFGANLYNKGSSAAPLGTIRYRICNGDESNRALSISSTFGENVTSALILIRGNDPNIIPEISSVSEATTSAPNPNSLTTSWQSNDTLWLEAFLAADPGTIDSYSTNFSQVAEITRTGIGIVGVAKYDLTSPTIDTLDPAAASFSSSVGSLSFTLAIYGAKEEDTDNIVIPIKGKGKKYSKQPPINIKLDRTNRLTDNLVYAYNLAFGATPIPDLVTNTLPTNVDMTSGESFSNYGPISYMSTTGTTGDIWNTNFDSGWSSSQAISGVCLMRTSNATDAGHVIGQRDGETTVWQFYHNGSGGLFFRKNVSAASTAGFITDTSWFLFGFSCSDLSSSGDCRVFKNGAFVQNLAVAANADALATDVTLGHRWAVEPTTGYEGPFDFGLVALWDRKLTDEEHAEIGVNPWALFERQVTYITIPKDKRRVVTF